LAVHRTAFHVQLHAPSQPFPADSLPAPLRSMTVAAFLPALGASLARRSYSPFAAGRSALRARAPRTLATMVLSAGDKVDTAASVMTLVDGKPTPLPLADVFSGKKVVLFSLPGALTPTCTDSQGPEFVEALAAFKAKGVDSVACLMVNDPFVGNVFEKKLNAVGKITFLCDGDAAVSKALGIDFDTGGFGGVRAKRGSFIVDNGVFTHVNLEEGGAFDGPGSAKTVLDQL
jgi:glutaredoxin/glutathione-dependent peroxiredoxin